MSIFKFGIKYSRDSPVKSLSPPRTPLRVTRPQDCAPPILPLLLSPVSIRRSLTLKYALAPEKRYIKFRVLFSALWCHIGNLAVMLVGLGKTLKFSFRVCMCGKIQYGVARFGCTNVFVHIFIFFARHRIFTRSENLISFDKCRATFSLLRIYF